GEFHQHRKIDAGENLDFRAPHHRDCEVGGCAAEHIGEDSHPLAAVHALDRLDDVLAALLHVVVGPDRHRLDLLLRAHHVLQGRAELGGEAPMGNKYEADHGAPRRRVPVAPHERPPIMTIRSPGARAFPAIWGRCCIASKGAPSSAGRSGNLWCAGYFCATGRGCKDHDRGLMSPSGEPKRARTRANASAPGATASRRTGTPRSALSPAAGSRSASSAARSTTNPTTAIGSWASRRVPRPRTSVNPASPAAGRTSSRP